jgi:hypothetical protein
VIFDLGVDAVLFLGLCVPNIVVQGIDGRGVMRGTKDGVDRGFPE